MVAISFILVLGAVSSYAYTVPLSRVKISDNGLMGYILHHEEDNQKSGFVEGHNIFPRSPGPEFKIETDYMESDSKGISADDDNSEEVLIRSESRFGDYDVYPYGTGFHSFLPYPPPHHGPNPGPYPPPFGQQQQPFPGHIPGNGWNNNFGHGPCTHGCGRGGHGNGFGPNNGFDHGHGHGHGHNYPPPGHAYGHGNDRGHDNDRWHDDDRGHGNNHGHGNGHGNGHGHGNDHGHGHGHGNGHGHGHGNGNNDNSDENEQMYSTEQPTPTIPITKPTPPVTRPVVTPVSPPVTQKPQTSAPITTENPIYDIDVRLGSSDE